jgi:hypothetical protein
MITDRADYGSPWGPRPLARFVCIKWFAKVYFWYRQTPFPRGVNFHSGSLIGRYEE